MNSSIACMLECALVSVPPSVSDRVEPVYYDGFLHLLFMFLHWLGVFYFVATVCNSGLDLSQNALLDFIRWVIRMRSRSKDDNDPNESPRTKVSPQGDN